MDSPSARKQGEFHWGSTLWHELTHVITLGITANRVPRWFTEGLSVYEETRARAGWGDPMTLTIVQALQQNKLIPLEDLNGAFVRPKYPTQIEVAYFQAGMACGFIADKHGFPKILAMLAAYGKGQNDAEVVQEVLGLSPAEFDTAFKAYAREHTNGFAQALNLEWAGADKTPEELRAEVEKNPGNYFARLHLAAALQKEKKFAEAISQAQAAQELFPSFTDGGNPYELLADAYEGLGRKDKAAGALLLWKERKGRNPKTFQRLATLLQDTGRTAEAIPVLQEALNVSMLDLDIHERLAESLAESAHPEAAVREYQAVLALDPPDKAEAHYRLAVAYQALSDVRSARQQVLAALEIAPGFRPAQKLLLELSANQ
jgi:tetratricopeptide (TPR) repeat protein